MGLFNFLVQGTPANDPSWDLNSQEQFIFSGSGDARVKESPGVPQGSFLPPGRSTIVWQKPF